MATDVNGVILGVIPQGVPHFAVPFTVGPDGSAETLQQDSVAEVVQSVAMLVGTTPGTRLMVPSYGTTDPTFAGLDVHALQQSAAKWEDRATVDVVITPGNQEAVSVTVAGGTP